MANAVNPKADTFAVDRLAELNAKIKSALSEPNVARIAKLVSTLGQGEYGKGLASEVKAGTPARTIVLGYTAARALEFAARPAYLRKDAGHVWTQVQRHAQNHLQQAKASLVATGTAEKASA